MDPRHGRLYRTQEEVDAARARGETVVIGTAAELAPIMGWWENLVTADQAATQLLALRRRIGAERQGTPSKKRKERRHEERKARKALRRERNGTQHAS